MSSEQYTLEETTPCKVCTEPTTMLGTKLCEGCWSTLRGMETMIRKLKCDLQITFQSKSDEPWNVTLRHNGDFIVKSCDTFQEALERSQVI